VKGWSEELDRAAQAIAGAPEVALACHEWPDGDALGSMMALFHLCRAQGRSSLASWPEPEEVAPHYRFLPGLDATTPPARFPSEPAVMVTFDCGSIERLGKLQVAARSAHHLIVLDHHATNSGYGSINAIDPNAAATAVMVRRLARRLDWPLNRDAALCLYTGLVTDTGRFQYANTTPEVFALAQELAAFDLPIESITRELFEKSRFAYIQMAAACLTRMRLDAGTGLVSATITEEDLGRFGVALEETEGFIDLVRRTAEARVAVVARYAPDGARVSLRSMDGTDVGAVAVSLGGGGHAHAAGFTHAGSVEEAVELVRAALAG